MSYLLCNVYDYCHSSNGILTDMYNCSVTELWESKKNQQPESHIFFHSLEIPKIHKTIRDDLWNIIAFSQPLNPIHGTYLMKCRKWMHLDHKKTEHEVSHHSKHLFSPLTLSVYWAMNQMEFGLSRRESESDCWCEDDEKLTNECQQLIWYMATWSMINRPTTPQGLCYPHLS